jgi:hypothetical protein
MKLKLKVEKEFDVKYLLARVGARYWEDSTLNGEPDEQGNMPCREGDYWSPLIDIERGIIMNWPVGNTADIHYKVCDDGIYHLLDENKVVIKSIEGYVPDIMCPEGEGYGDYVIMKIKSDASIANWEVTLSEFENEQ